MNKFLSKIGERFTTYPFLVFLVVFICLPTPHGNIYPFIFLITLALYQGYNKEFQYIIAEIPYLFLIWILLSFIWTTDKIVMIKILTKISLILFGGWVWWCRYSQFDSNKKLQIQKCAFYGAVSIAGLIAVDILRCEIFYGNYSGQNGWFKYISPHITNALVHGCVACSLAIWIGLQNLSRLIRAIILTVACYTILRATSDAAALGILLGGATLVTHKFFPHFVRLVFIYGMPAIWIAFPFIFKYLNYSDFLKWSSLFDSSYTHRLFIWHSTSAQVFQKFWTGFGLGSSRYRYCFVEPSDIPIWYNNQKMILAAPENCLHPHNFMVQIWLELGAIGTILGCVAWIIYWRKRYEKCDSYTMAFWGSALCIAGTSISVWQSWWIILLALLIPIYSQKVNQSSPFIAK